MGQMDDPKGTILGLCDEPDCLGDDDEYCRTGGIQRPSRKRDRRNRKGVLA